jgi:hypothetical protein
MESSKSETQTCNRCIQEKSLHDFYSYTNRGYKSICKQCENTNSSKYELWYCQDCDMTIRQRCKTKHLKSNRHTKCRFLNETYDYEKLQKQNKRTM